MKIPQSTHLTSQNFNSDQIEYVWHFPRPDEFFDQVIFIVNGPNPTFYIEVGKVNDDETYVEEPVEYKVDYSHIGSEPFLIYEDNWPNGEIPPIVSNAFNGGQDLVSLVDDTVKYLKVSMK